MILIRATACSSTASLNIMGSRVQPQAMDHAHQNVVQDPSDDEAMEQDFKDPPDDEDWLKRCATVA